MTYSLRRSFIAILLYLLGASCAQAQLLADKILFNARAYTMDSSTPWAEAVAISGDRITYVGNNAGALRLAGSQTRQFDLQGKMLLPGFIDTHMHPVTGGSYARALSLDTFGTVEDWLAAIGEFAATHESDPLIFGYGFLATTFGPGGPTRQMLDAVVADRPILIMDEGFHGAWANSKALEMLDIDRDTPDPAPGFSYYKRDAQGEPTGYLLEGTATLAMDGLNAITEDVIVEGTAHVIDVLNSFGVTSVFDAGAGSEQDSLQAILQRLEKTGDMTVRIVGSYLQAAPEGFEQAVANAIKWQQEVRGNNFHYRMLKIMLDGTVEGRTAAMFEDYQGEPGNNGKLVFTPAQTRRMVVDAAGANIDVHIHALGERAVHEALNAVEAARDSHASSSSRYTLCHLQVIRDEDLQRFSELDVIAQSTPLWAAYDVYGKQFVSDDQFSRYWRFKSLADHGVRLTWGSDFPSSGAGMAGMSPVLQMEIGHTRQAPGQPDSLIQPRKSERLGMEALIRGYTIDAAYQLHMEDELGSLVVGKKADLVVLDENLFDTDSHAIHQVGVVMTVMNGEVVYQGEMSDD